MIYQQDARLIPTYTFADTARYLRVPVQTVRNWAVGNSATGALIDLDDPARQYLSFWNLVEVHVVAGIRKVHGVRIPAVRSALDYVRERFDVARPLIDEKFKTDGKSLFVEKYGEMINATSKGQVTLEGLLTAQLERIDRDKLGFPVQLHPYTRPLSSGQLADQPKTVVINPRISFGRPSVRGVPTSVIWDRYLAGDSRAYLSEDYGLDLDQIDEAIRCEAIRQAA